MRLALLFPLLAITLAGPALAGQAGTAPPAAAAQMIRLTSEVQGGVSTTWEIPLSRATGLPRWNPETATPVSIADAAVTARRWLTQQHPQMQQSELQGVSLSRVRRGVDVDLWYYQVDFYGYTTARQSDGPLFKVVILSDRSVVEPTRNGGETSTAGFYQPGPGITMPRVLHDVKPGYTAEAIQRKISGSVTIQGVVGTDGSFRNLRVVKSLDAVYGLDEAALKAAEQWQFTPGTRDGQPVPILMTIEMSFSVKD